MSKINMIKTFILNSDSHVSIDLKKGAEGKMILSVSVEDLTKPTANIEDERTVEFFLKRTIELGLMDSDYKWKKIVTQPQIALWVDMCSNIVGMENKWLWAESMWGYKYLKQVRSRSINEKGIVVGEKEIFACFD